MSLPSFEVVDMVSIALLHDARPPLGPSQRLVDLVLWNIESKMVERGGYSCLLEFENGGSNFHRKAQPILRNDLEAKRLRIEPPLVVQSGRLELNEVEERGGHCRKAVKNKLQGVVDSELPMLYSLPLTTRRHERSTRILHPSGILLGPCRLTGARN
jgi:hypothetical protein